MKCDHRGHLLIGYHFELQAKVVKRSENGSCRRVEVIKKKGRIDSYQKSYQF